MICAKAGLRIFGAMAVCGTMMQSTGHAQTLIPGAGQPEVVMECVDENDKKLAACLIHCGQMFSPAPGTPGNALVENYVSDVELYTHGAGRRDERIWFAYKYKKTNTEQVADWVNFLTLGPNVYCSFPGFPGTTAKPRIGFKVKRFANQ